MAATPRGGAVNIVTRNADYDGIHGFVAGEYGNFKDWKVGGAVNVPILPDVLSARVAYQHWNREGYGKSDVTGQRAGGDHDDDVARHLPSLRSGALPVIDD
jgi:iron complex outermembrane recepter protein